MYDTLQKLKGISCILARMAQQEDGTEYEWTPELMFLLNNSLRECIEKIEKLNIEID